MTIASELIDGILGVKKQQQMAIAPLPDYKEQLESDQAKATAEAAARRRTGLREQLTIELPDDGGVGTGLQIPT